MTRKLPPELIARAVQGASMEWYLTDPNAFGLTTASPLQRAVCRVFDGLPIGELGDDPDVRRAFGNVGELPRKPPRELAILSGIRTGKSLFAACAAVMMALTCDMTGLRTGEPPRVSIVSLTKDLAEVIFNHVVGGLESSRILRSFVLSKDSDTVVLRHPSGRPVEIKVVAGARAGASLVARWSAGAIFDEFPRMLGGDAAVVNWDDQRNGVLLRLLPGCKLLHIGSPYAPYGPAYELATSQFGKPTANLVVVRAPAPAMNPVYWTPERVAAARAADPEAAKTDVDADFATPDEAMFSSESLDRCIRQLPLTMPRKPGCTYFAAMDPATRGNGWTLAIATRDRGKTVVVRTAEWIGSRDQPLDPGDVLQEAATICAEYGVTTIHSDQVMGDALVRLARERGITLFQWTYQQAEKAKKYLAIRTNLDLGLIELPNTPHLRTDLLHIRKKVTPGGIAVVLPMTSDGRHCDWGPTLMLVLSKLLPEPTTSTGAPEVDPETARMREMFLRRCGALPPEED